MGRAVVMRSAWLFPAALLALFVMLVATGVNGSSLALLSVKPPVTVASTVSSAEDPDLLWGKPRPIRSDEWAISTPLAVGQTADGFNPQPWVGLTPTDLSVISYSAPQKALVSLMKPETWGYLVLGAERGLAWAWWFPWLSGALALYALLLLLTRRPGLSAGLAALGTLTPYAAWWTSPAPNLFIGFSAAAAALFLLATRAVGAIRRVALGALAGYFAMALMLTLYPPWVLTTALVMVALVAGVLLDSRLPIKRLVLPVAGALSTAVIIGAWWFAGADEDLKAISDTIYPGQRVSGPGEARIDQFLSAYANPYTALTDVQPALSNQSEIAGVWLALPLVLLLLLMLVILGRRLSPELEPAVMGGWTVAALAAVSSLLLGWSLWPGFPPLLGRVLLLTRVPGVRVPLALGLALLLLVAALNQHDLGRAGEWWVLPVGLIASLLTAGLASWAAQRIYPDLGEKWPAVVFVGAAIVAAALAAVALNRGVRIALPVAVVYALVSIALVNPMYRGLGPLRQDPVARYALNASVRDPAATAIVLGGRELNALVRGSGMQVLSGTTLYPNISFWESVLPEDPTLWNNYRNYEWSYDPTADPVTGTVTAPDAALLQVDLCDPAIRDLGYDAVFALDRVDAPCLQLTSTIQRPDGELVRVYTPRS